MLYRIAESLYPAWNGLATTVSSRLRPGTNVFSREWDMLVILDTCRIDALRAVAPEFDFLPPADEIGSLWSVGSMTAEFVANTFVSDFEGDFANTAVFAQNSHYYTVLEERRMPEDERPTVGAWTNWQTVSPNAFEHLDHVWRRTTDDIVTMESIRATTDAAVHYARRNDPERLLVHYNRPHHPYRANAIEEDRTDEELHDHERDPFTYLREGGDFETVWESYLDDLRMGLRDVEHLISNVDAENVVITADHGDGFGEWGFVYSHPFGFPHPVVRRVPWAETTASDSGGYEPKPPETDAVHKSVTDQLEELGYL
ncbi:hypothetical protein [Halorhabdus rudnickae]|uniref:hypothetical protein n=1 Tax=Halorhabdus rudnickae TaxID=1775544 RepID=UPI001083F4F4|nr:hypothetical protein [Halorhabdus rudnickae]